MLNAQMRKAALRRYLVYRIKAIEFLDLAGMRQELVAHKYKVPSPIGRTDEDFVAALRTVQLSWFAIFVDKSKDGMDVIPLWKDLFPKLRTEIDEAWKRMEPAWNTIRAFRDKAGFHADKPLQFFRARREISVQHKEVTAALKEFEMLQRKILHSEASELPELETTLDELLEELEEGQQRKYQRAEFKRYVMLPNTRGK